MIRTLRIALLIQCLLLFIPAAASDIPNQNQEEELLEIELPKPMFVGTPKNIRSPNLERITGKPRGPFYVPKGTVLLSMEKVVTSSDYEPVIGGLEFVTDGEKTGEDGYYVELGPSVQWVQIDLGQSYSLHAILIWH